MADIIIVRSVSYKTKVLLLKYLSVAFPCVVPVLYLWGPPHRHRVNTPGLTLPHDLRSCCSWSSVLYDFSRRAAASACCRKGTETSWCRGRRVGGTVQCNISVGSCRLIYGRCWFMVELHLCLVTKALTRKCALEALPCSNRKQIAWQSTARCCWWRAVNSVWCKPAIW